MRMLFIHCDYFSYLTTKKTDIAESIRDGCKSCAVKDALVVFLTVEGCDESDPMKVLLKCVREIANMAKRINAKNLVLFPFVHLSDDVCNQTSP